MPYLNRDCQRLVLRLRGWTIDQRIIHGIAPGRLIIPELHLPEIHVWLEPDFIRFDLHFSSGKVGKFCRFYGNHYVKQRDGSWR